MEAPLEASALSSYLSIQKALKAVRKERKGNQLGWVPYRPAQLEDYPERPADWESACEQQCEKLGIDFGETKCHLEWATGLAGSIEKGQKAFCYGAIHRFPDHDVRHAELVLNPTAAAPQKKAKASLRARKYDHLQDLCRASIFGLHLRAWSLPVSLVMAFASREEVEFVHL